MKQTSELFNCGLMEISFIRKTPFKKTVAFFDFYKGILVLFVIVYHIMELWRGLNADQSMYLPSEDVLYKLIGFIMPSFFIITGFGYKPMAVKSFACRYTKMLLLPYLYTALAVIAIVLLKDVLRGRNVIPDLITYVCSYLFVHLGKGSVVLPFLKEVGTVWYVWTLYLTFFLLNIIFLIKNDVVNKISIILMMLLGMYISKFRLEIFCIPQALVACGLVYIGYLLNKNKWFSKPMPKSWTVFLLFFAITSLIFGGSNMGEFYWRLGLIDYIGSIATALLLLKAYSYIVLPTNRGVEIIMTLGRYSLWILCLHGVDMIAMKWENVIFYFHFPIWINIGLHVVLDGTFIFIGCAALIWLRKLRYKLNTAS